MVAICSKASYVKIRSKAQRTDLFMQLLCFQDYHKQSAGSANQFAYTKSRREARDRRYCSIHQAEVLSISGYVSKYACVDKN